MYSEWVNTTRITYSLFENNAATSGGGGGGIYARENRTLLEITHSTFSGNDAEEEGGGIYVTGNGDIEFTNNTISGNHADVSGGGLFLDIGGGFIRYNTISFNSTDSTVGLGGGIFNDTGSILDVYSTILAGNTGATGPDCEDVGAMASADYNLVQDSSSCSSVFIGANDIIAQDPLLLPLADNGGSTQTHGLPAASPAMSYIPAGTVACGTDVTDDQRDKLRPGTYIPVDRCEVGAWEAYASPTSVSIMGLDARPANVLPTLGPFSGLALLFVVGAALLLRRRMI